MHQYVWVGLSASSLDRATTVGGGETGRPASARVSTVDHDPSLTGTEFVHTARRAQHDRPILRHCGDGGLNRESASAFSGGRYPPRVRRIIALAALLGWVCACGSSAA